MGCSRTARTGNFDNVTHLIALPDSDPGGDGSSLPTTTV